MFSSKIIIILLFFLCSHAATSAQSGDSTIWEVHKTNTFKVTGDGTAPNWSSASWLRLPQRNVNEKTARRDTRIKLLYSDSGIYCLYLSEDPKITATLKEDFADLYNEDVVEAFFWPDESEPIYFEYELSPMNFELPILVPNIKGTYLGWRPWHYEGNRKTQHAAKINREKGEIVSWTAEFYIPFLLLKPLANSFPGPGTRWRANFYRIDYDNNVLEWSWQETKANFHEYKKFGTIIFR
jgi:hypothetical protein